jgi:hypothetical protein
VADHSREARVDVARFTDANLVDSGLHVVVDAAAGHASQRGQAMVVGIEEHFMGLEQIGSQDKGAAVGKFGRGSVKRTPWIW